MTYKVLPIDKKVIEQMRISTPDLYSDMIGRFGEENVINNLLVDYVILTENKNIVTGKDGVQIVITKEKIDEIERASNSAFNVYLKEPINKLKSWMTTGDSSLGYTPILLDHNQVSTRQGYVIGGSYKKASIDGKWHLLCKAVLISPEAKFKYLQGLYREVSPTISNANNRIIELSIVNVPAQMTNTSLSAEDVKNIPVQIASVADEWTQRIKEAQLQAQIETEQYKVKQKENVAHELTEQLLKKGVITSSQRSRFQNVFIQLSSGEETLVAQALAAVGTSPLNRKPRNVFLKGTIDMSKTRDERFLAFSNANHGKFKTDQDLRAAFEKSEAATNISLSDGEGAVIDPMTNVMDQLEALKKGGALTDEHKKMLAAYCGHEVKLESDGAVGNGQPTDAGTEIGIPNNTSLSAPEIPVNPHLNEMLEKGFEAVKAEAAVFKARAEAAEANLASIKQTLGVA